MRWLEKVGTMRIIDGHTHKYQAVMPAHETKRSVAEIEGLDVDLLLARLDEMAGISFPDDAPGGDPHCTNTSGLE